MNVVLVSHDLAEDPDRLQRFRESHGSTWNFATTSEEMIHDFGVFIRATKIIIDPNGTIVDRAGYGMRSESQWNEVLSKAVESFKVRKIH